MTLLHLYDDARARRFEPFALTRPVSELRAGAELIRRRWARALGAEPAGFIGSPHLAELEELDTPPATTSVGAGAIVANARCAIALDAASHEVDVWRCGGRVAAVRLREAPPAEALAAGTLSLDALVPAGAAEAVVAGWWLDEVWDLVSHLPAMLAADIDVLARSVERAVPTGLTTLGTHEVTIERGAEIEPLVVFDVTAGPVLVRRGAHVAAFTRLVGPCVIGEDSTVLGGRIAVSSIGEHCKVHGELSTTIFCGHANKSHDGFVGHSVLGRWVNLGASTVTSNLKNTYGAVALWTPEGPRDTGLQFLGTMFGDHAKTAIGTRLTTGSVIGAGANVFGPGMAPKVVPPFAWGTEPGAEPYAVERFLVVAARAMARRQVTLGERQRRTLAARRARRWSVDA